MKLSLYNSKNFSKFSIPSKKKIIEALGLIEEKFENSAGKSVNIKFCKIDEISALNKEFRKKDTPTKQKAAVVLEKMTKEGEEIEKINESLDWLDVEDVSFFDVGTNVFSSGGKSNEGEEVQL